MEVLLHGTAPKVVVVVLLLPLVQDEGRRHLGVPLGGGGTGRGSTVVAVVHELVGDEGLGVQEGGGGGYGEDEERGDEDEGESRHVSRGSEKTTLLDEGSVNFDPHVLFLRR